MEMPLWPHTSHIHNCIINNSKSQNAWKLLLHIFTSPGLVYKSDVDSDVLSVPTLFHCSQSMWFRISLYKPLVFTWLSLSHPMLAQFWLKQQADKSLLGPISMLERCLSKKGKYILEITRAWRHHILKILILILLRKTFHVYTTLSLQERQFDSKIIINKLKWDCQFPCLSINKISWYKILNNNVWILLKPDICVTSLNVWQELVTLWWNLCKNWSKIG